MFPIAVGIGILAAAALSGCADSRIKKTRNPSTKPHPKNSNNPKNKKLVVCEPEQPHPTPPEKTQVQVPKSSQPCPKGWQSYPLRIGGGQVEVCHQESHPADAIFQKGSEKLGLQIGDRFVSQEDTKFSQWSQNFYLPNFSERNLRLWHDTHEFLFPEGATFRGEEDYRDVWELIHEQNFDFQEIKRMAAQVQPAPAIPERGWRGLESQEKVYALTIVTLLKSLAKEQKQFYLRNQDFVDAVIPLIEGGKLCLQEVPKGIATGPVGYLGTSFLTYFTAPNVLQMGEETELGLQNIRQKALLLHELYHFYQDSQKLALSFEENEVQAYLTQAEFIIFSLLEAGQKTPRDSVEYFLRENPDIIDALKLALGAVQNQLEGNSEKAKEEMDRLKRQISIDYFLKPIVLKLERHGFMKFEHQRVEGAKVYFKGNVPRETQELLPFFRNMAEIQKLARDKELDTLKAKLSENTRPKSFEELENDFAAVVGESITYILHKREFEARGMGFKAFCPDFHRDIEINKLLNLLAELRPLQRCYMPNDGV